MDRHEVYKKTDIAWGKSIEWLKQTILFEKWNFFMSVYFCYTFVYQSSSFILGGWLNAYKEFVWNQSNLFHMLLGQDLLYWWNFSAQAAPKR